MAITAPGTAFLPITAFLKYSFNSSQPRWHKSERNFGHRGKNITELLVCSTPHAGGALPLLPPDTAPHRILPSVFDDRMGKNADACIKRPKVLFHRNTHAKITQQTRIQNKHH